MSEKMREEFEAFYESYMLDEGRRIEYVKNEIASFKPERNKYGYSDAQEFWVVWQASRAALVVELPEKAALMSASSVYAALDDAGVAYK